ncbi:hypothetical protein [Nostoc sp.]|uniref:hypothetical protein n=1 Tax=Nostoc sp. TaxID=1180 RepID=UPI002FF833DC
MGKREEEFSVCSLASLTMPNTTLGEARPTATLRDAVGVRSVQVPNAQCPIPNAQYPIPNTQCPNTQCLRQFYRSWFGDMR